MAAAAGGTGEDPVSNNGPIAPGQSSEGVSTDAAAAADINRGRIICLKMFWTLWKGVCFVEFWVANSGLRPQKHWAFCSIIDFLANFLTFFAFKWGDFFKKKLWFTVCGYKFNHMATNLTTLAAFPLALLKGQPLLLEGWSENRNIRQNIDKGACFLKFWIIFFYLDFMRLSRQTYREKL